MREYFDFFLKAYTAIGTRYAVLAFIAFILFYVLLKNKWSYKKIQKKFPSNSDYRREIGFSILTIVIFALMGVLIFKSPLSPYSQIYYDFSAMPVWYYIATFGFMLVAHDTYFYWMHRTLHHPKIFKFAHLTHHKSTNPSPWAAYSFHPIEAFFEAAILPVMAFAFPIHISAFGLFFLFQIVYNVYGHLGYELYPKGFNTHWFGKWINTSTHHNLHHKDFDNSYGLYFTFWDRLMGTMSVSYDVTFEEVKSRTAA